MFTLMLRILLVTFFFLTSHKTKELMKRHFEHKSNTKNTETPILCVSSVPN